MLLLFVPMSFLDREGVQIALSNVVIVSLAFKIIVGCEKKKKEAGVMSLWVRPCSKASA